MPNIVRRAALPLLLLIAAIAPATAFAALGGDVGSVLKDGEALGAAHAVTNFVAYDRHESVTADGVRLRQYVDRAGSVFAVTWSGPRSPDVSALLGSHAAHYRESLRTRPGNHHVATLIEPGLEVSVVKLPRGWRASAILPGAIPAGVDRTVIR